MNNNTKVEAILTVTEAIAYRKANYWRGFIASLLLVTLPLIIAFMVFCNHIINKLN